MFLNTLFQKIGTQFCVPHLTRQRKFYEAFFLWENLAKPGSRINPVNINSLVLSVVIVWSAFSQQTLLGLTGLFIMPPSFLM